MIFSFSRLTSILVKPKKLIDSETMTRRPKYSVQTPCDITWGDFQFEVCIFQSVCVPDKIPV